MGIVSMSRVEKMCKVCAIGILSVFMGGCAPLMRESIATMEANPIKAGFALPSEVRHQVGAFPREALVGKWQGTTAVTCALYHGNRASKPNTFYIRSTYVFQEDGKYRVNEVWSDKKDSTEGLVRSKVGTWSFADGILTLNETYYGYKQKVVYQDVEKLYKVDWYSQNEMRLRWKTKGDGTTFYTKYIQADYGTPYYKATVDYDERGCTVIRCYLGNDEQGSTGMYVESPENYRRIFPSQYDFKVNNVSRESHSVNGHGPKRSKNVYRIISCERDNANEFSYRFALSLVSENDNSLETFSRVQQEFRNAIKRDYTESFPSVDAHSIYVDFPEYKLNNGKIEGRAVVLTISVTSLTYDPSTRTGKLAVKVNANQYEEARKWIRKNIETLARDKNIALVTGEIPPAAKFYLGREELKDGNVLEIEFKTE